MQGKDYNKLRKDYESVRKEAVRKNREVQKLDDELKEVRNARVLMNKNYRAAYAEEQTEAAKAYKARMMEPVEKALAAAEDRLQSYKNDYEQQLDSITEENLLSQCSTWQEILDDVKNASFVVKERLETALGERFYMRLNEQLSVSKIKLGQSDLNRVITYFNRCEKQLQKMADRPDRLGVAISEIDSALKGLDGSVMKIDKKGVTVAAAGLIILAALAYKYVFPFYVLVLGFVAAYNVYRSYLLYKIMIVHKAVQDNILEIEELLHKQICAEAAKRREETQQYYDKRISDAESEIQEYKKQLTDISVMADHSFKFDDSGLRSVYDSSLKRQESKEMNLLQTKQQLKNESEALAAKLDEMKENLDQIVGDLKNRYINFEKAGTSVLFQTEFLFDIDAKRSRPVFFSHPEKSCLILYEDRMEAINFIKLLCVQVRSSLSPKCYTMTYYDDKTLGRDCLSFVPESGKKGDAVLKLFQLKTTAEDLKETILNYAMEMRKRQKDLREDRNIRKYNKHMVEIDSITLPYLFGFWLDAASIVMNLPETTLLLRTAGDYGIFVHLFISVSDFYELGKKAKDLVTSVERIYLLKDGEYLERAKDFVLENMVKT